MEIGETEMLWNGDRAKRPIYIPVCGRLGGNSK
jgi:hypothetical protein